MSRLRSRLASNEADREFQKHLADANRALGRALDLCNRLARARYGQRNGQQTRRAKEHIQVLMRTLRVLDNLGHLVEGPVQDDPDLRSSDEDRN